LIAACFSYTAWFILQVCFPPFFIYIRKLEWYDSGFFQVN
jgi:hypothetical protein